jgi:hypothetical protein
MKSTTPKYKQYSRSLLLLSLCMVYSLLTGCATLTHEGMVPTKFEITKKHSQSVSISVTGGGEGAAQISDISFMKALTDSIAKSQTFSRIVEGKDGDYLLTVSIFNVERPSLPFGLSFTINMEAGWTLQRINNKTIIWQESIKSTHTATIDDAFVGAKRFQLAIEGAARNNIAQGLAKISQLSLL